MHLLGQIISENTLAVVRNLRLGDIDVLEVFRAATYRALKKELVERGSNGGC